jgi:hypothetical protein
MEKLWAEMGTWYFWLALIGLPYSIGLLTTATYGPISKGVETGASKVSQTFILRSKKAQDRIYKLCDALQETELREHVRSYSIMTLGAMLFETLLVIGLVSTGFLLKSSPSAFMSNYVSGSMMLIAGWNMWKVGTSTRKLIFLQRGLIMYEDLRMPPGLTNYTYPPKVD